MDALQNFHVLFYIFPFFGACGPYLLMSVAKNDRLVTFLEHLFFTGKLTAKHAAKHLQTRACTD